MNSKLILAIAAIIVIGGGIFAVRSLTTTDTVMETEETRMADSDATRDDSSTRAGDTRISSADRDRDDTRRTGSGRTFSRGEGAAALEVTPATTTTEQMAATATATPDETTTTSEEDSRRIADLVAMFRNQTDPEERIDIADELGMIDSPESIKSVLELLKTETDPEVQVALLEAMQALEALELTAPEVLQAAKDIYSSTEDIDVRIAAQDLLGDVANADAANTLRDWRNTEDPVSRLNITENLMRVWATDNELVSSDEVEMYNGQLQQDYEAGPDAEFRSQAIMGLAINGRENVQFFRDALQIEQDPNLRTLLERLVTMYSTPAPSAPPAGTVVTPVPTPYIAE